MPDSAYQIEIVVVFFIYGLAFFSMGLAMALEAGRSPLLAEARILRPLAVFGLLHGIHEWIEIFVLQMQWLNVPFPSFLLWVRLGLLAISFASLVAYGIQVLRPPERLAALDAGIGFGLLALYVSLIFISGPFSLGGINLFVNRADVLARYVLAVPGAVLAALALRHQARQRKVEERHNLAVSLYWAAFGFTAYGITQVFVSRLDIFPARFLNAELFLDLFGIPIQVVRAVMALVIMISLNRATHFVEQERQRQLHTAQDARLAALQLVQEELIKRETLRRELLRHTVIAQEEERARIARELHDETAQTLTAFTLDLATLQTQLPESSAGIGLVNRLQNLSRQMSQGLYRMVHDLRPAQLDDLGLIPAIQYLINEGQAHTGLEVDLEIKGSRQRMDPLVETVLFRVVQEALTNVARHANTKQVAIQFAFDEHQVMLRVEDDGAGFDLSKFQKDGRGWGLAGMRERTESVGGVFNVQSAPGAGTIIEVTIPCVEQNQSNQQEGELT
jgi:signal transduction histidine kinase